MTISHYHKEYVERLEQDRVTLREALRLLTFEAVSAGLGDDKKDREVLDMAYDAIKATGEPLPPRQSWDGLNKVRL